MDGVFVLFFLTDTLASFPDPQETQGDADNKGKRDGSSDYAANNRPDCFLAGTHGGETSRHIPGNVVTTIFDYDGRIL